MRRATVNVRKESQKPRIYRLKHPIPNQYEGTQNLRISGIKAGNPRWKHPLHCNIDTLQFFLRISSLKLRKICS